MKKLVYILAYCLISACQGPKRPSESAPITAVDSVNKKISKPDTSESPITPSSVPAIRKAYAATMERWNTKDFDSIAISYTCKQERSGTITYYSARGKISLIKHAYSEYDHHSATDHYFVANDTLYFVYSNKVSWSFESGSAGQAATKDDITESRTYLLEGKSALCLEKKYSIHSQRPDPTLAERTPNRTVNCKPTLPLVNTYKKLVAFQKRANGECFD